MRLKSDDVLPPGFRLHWYQVQSLLGDGGFGITYLARDTNLNQLVAIKEYFPKSVVSRGEGHEVVPGDASDEEFFRWGLKRFLDEARLLARFRHPNIVRVLSVFECLGTAFMVMELARGKSLSDAIRSHSIVTDDQVLDVCIPLLDGLAMVHEAGFIHRDIKPNNILLRPGLGPVLIDFGSARRPRPGMSSELTAIVSRGYAPFEQYDAGNEQRQGPWSDIYGLAATLYHAITGGAPVDAMTRGMCHLNGDPDPFVPATRCAPGRFSSTLLGAVDRGLVFRAGDRPRSVGEWREMFPAHSAVRPPHVDVSTEALDRAAETNVDAVPRAAPMADGGAAATAPPIDEPGDESTVRNPVVADTDHLRRRILVVDDERAARTLTTRILTNLGATHVDTAGSAEEALARLDDARAVPELMVCDLEMPGMDGIQFLRHLAERSVHAPLILVADGDERLLGAARHLASVHGLAILGCMRKPVTPDRMVTLLSRLDVTPAGGREDDRSPAHLGDATLRDGIAGGELDLVYLPTVSVKDRELLGAEALMRWRGARGEGLDVAAVVKRVEAMGLADAFTEQVLRKALAQAGEWRAAGLPCSVSVNMFAASLRRLDLPEHLVAVAEEEGVTPRDVILEVDEVDFLAQRDVPLEILARLRLRGVGLAVDDFGTGSSTLDRLRHIPFTEIKVDRSFVAAACEERTARVILESSVALARRLGLRAVAEGVADERTWDLVSRLGFDAAQGFHVSAPLPGDRLAEWSRDWSMGRVAPGEGAMRASA